MNDLEALRARIDAADRQMLEALRERFAAVAEIGALKRRSGAAVVQPGRWAALVRQRLAWAAELGVDARFCEELLALVHREAQRIQGEGR
jgi:chorismate mutase